MDKSIISDSNIADAVVVAKSQHAETGKELVTFEVEYPRIVHCFHPNTEFLSQIGDEFPRFRKYDEIVALCAKVAQYRPDGGFIDFVHPLNTIKRHENNSLVTYRGKLNISVTGEHRMFSLRRTTNNTWIPHVDTAQEWCGEYSAHRRIPQAGQYSGERNDMLPEEAALIAWFVADGHLPKNSNRAQFHFKKKRKIDSVKYLLEKNGIEYDECVYNDSTVLRFPAPQWVKNCYDNGEKTYPDFIWDMSEDAFLAFKEATILSDGNLEDNGINTTSMAIAEQTQVLSLLNNTAMNIRSYGAKDQPKRLYKQGYQVSNYTSFRRDVDRFEAIPYNGEVVCFEVPSSFLVVRLEGTAYVSGNCEVMTHRQFSRNASSSRAIPTATMTSQLEQRMFVPTYFGMNQSGMQAEQQLDEEAREIARELWIQTGKNAIEASKAMQAIKMHKQLANRVTEAFQFIKVVITATEFENFFWLRDHTDAQPEIAELARVMKKARDNAHAIILHPGDWHLPYYRDGAWLASAMEKMPLEDARKISVSCSAQVSYRKNDDSLEKAENLFSLFFETDHIHASPSEHQATPLVMPRVNVGNVSVHEVFAVNGELATHVDRNGDVWSGNLRHFGQYRQGIPGNVKM
jgi:hypothetical protein